MWASVSSRLNTSNDAAANDVDDDDNGDEEEYVYFAVWLN